MREKRFGKKSLIGVDIGGTNVKIAVVSARGIIRAKTAFSTKRYNTKKKILGALASGIREIAKSGGTEKTDIIGIGIGAPGLIDSKNGIIHYLVNIKGFREVPVKKIIQAEFKIPTFVDNDANVMCLGELVYGAGRGGRNILAVTLGTGVGGGIAINGKLYRGSTLSAGEIGHVTINENGPRCNCGNRGCLETYVGNSYIARNAIKRIKGGGKSLILKLAGGDTSNITPKIISEAARKGDRLAASVLTDAGRSLGVGLAGIVNVLNPDKIIIGGGVANAGKILFDAIISTVRARGMKVPARAVAIVKARLGEDAGLVGAAALALEGVKRS